MSALDHVDVRLATKDDTKALFVLLSEMHKEMAIAPLHIEKAALSIAEGIENGEVLVALDAKGKLIGTIGVIETSWWYSDETHLSDRFFFTARSERGDEVGKALLEAVTMFSESRNLPLIITVTNPKRARPGRHWQRTFDAALFIPAGYGLLAPKGNDHVR